MGQPIEMRFVLEGDHHYEIPQKRFETKDVIAYYSGIETNTTIIQFKVKKEIVLKFALQSKGPGDFQTPPVWIILDQSKIEFPSRTFRILQGAPPRTRNPFHIFEEDLSEEINSTNTKALFRLNQKSAYVGQSIVGYYLLLTMGEESLSMERDPSQSISFPFFISDKLGNVQISVAPEMEHNGYMYQTKPYNKEIYSLTPLKSGKYKLGEANFFVQYDHGFQLQPVKIASEPTYVDVVPLPKPEPRDFHGEVGKYEWSTEIERLSTSLGEGIPMTFRIWGNGTLRNIKDPFQIESKDLKVILIREEKKQDFREWEKGKFGFFTELVWFYSIQPKRVGSIEGITRKTSYFDPELGVYKEIYISIPELKVSEAKEKPPIPKPEKTISFLYPIFIGGLGVIILVGMYFYKRIYHPMDKVYWHSRIGKKRGIVLEQYLLEKGFSEEDTKFIVYITEGIPGSILDHDFRNLSSADAKRLSQISKNYPIEV
jgi:hypothetical protein